MLGRKLKSYKLKFKQFSIKKSFFFLKGTVISNALLHLLPLAQIWSMAKLEAGSTLQRLRNRYRLVVMNDDTYEEVVTFRLSRMSVYILLCTIFVVLVGLTVALIVFTPVKYYIPGYGNIKMDREYRELKYVVDSLEKQVSYHEQYSNSLRKVLTGNADMKLDTVLLQVPKDDESSD